jgi:streptogramin lyase
MLNGSRVGRIDPATGGMTEFPLPAGDRPGDIALGPDGNVWFIHYAPATFTIDRITPSGNITAFPFPAGGSPGSLAAGPDGTFWMTEADPNKIAQLDPATGVVTEFPLPSPRSSPYEITLGPDGNLWFVEAAGNRIGRLSP